MTKIKICFYCVCLVVLLVFLNCSDNSNPFSPVELPYNELAYFPLEVGYKADYTFSYNYDYDRSRIEKHLLNGTFHFEVIDTHIIEPVKKVFFKIETTFFIQEEYYLVDNNIYDYPPEPDEEYTKNNFTIIGEYDIMFKDGSLWYVENAPSFDRLDEGDTTLMMAIPIASGGEINLKLFKYPELYPFFDRDNTILILYNSFSDSTYHYQYWSPDYPPGKVYNANISKSKGIESFTYEVRWGMSDIASYSANFSFVMLE